MTAFIIKVIYFYEYTILSLDGIEVILKFIKRKTLNSINNRIKYFISKMITTNEFTVPIHKNI